MVRLQDSISKCLHHHTFFPTCFWTRYLKRIMPKFIMFWPRGECLTYSPTNLPMFSINFPSLFHKVSYTTWIAPSFNCRYPLMHVHTSQWPYGYPPLTLCSWQWTHKNPWCNLWHLYCHCARCWFQCRAKIITFLQTHSTPFVNKSTLCSPEITFTP